MKRASTSNSRWIGVYLVGIALAWAAGPAPAVTATRGAFEKGGVLLDEQAIVIENAYLRGVVMSNRYAGQMMSLVYKPTGQELAAEKHDQGYFKDRVGHNRYFWRSEGRDYRGRIIRANKDEAVVETSYTWDYDNDDRQTTFTVSKTFTLRADESRISCAWRFENTGDTEVRFTPWMKHMGGSYAHSGVLAGPHRMVFANGAQDMGENDFYDAQRGWMGRVSAGQSSEKFPMVYSVYNYRDLYQHFSWNDRQRYTLETIFTPVTVAPGKALTNTFELCVAPSLRHLSVATPEIAVGVARGDQLAAAGKAQTVILEIAATKDLGSIRLEGDISIPGEGTLAKLPHRVVELGPGRIARAEYEFTPLEEGVYSINLTLFSGQTPIVLGRSVESQEAGLVVPIVVGQRRPARVVGEWHSSGPAFRSRPPRSVTPLRLVARSAGLTAGQFGPLDRLFPEDSMETSGDLSTGIEVDAARNEWESTQMLVTLDLACKGGALMVSATDLTGPGGSLIRAPEAYEVKYVTTTTPSSYRDYPIGQWPDPLFPVRPRHVKGGDQVTYWFSFRVPKGASPGTYTGSVELKLDLALLASVPVRLNVRDFALPDRPTFRVNAGRVGFYDWRYITSNWEALGVNLTDAESKSLFRELSDEWWRICAEYGISPRGGGIERWEKYMDHGRGLTLFSVAAADVDRDEPWLKENDLLKYSFVYLTNFDEHSDSDVPDVARYAADLKARTHIPIMDCYYGNRCRDLFGLIDIWCGQSVNQPWVAHRQEAGDRFWSVNNSLIWFIEFEPVQGRREFWQDFVDGLDGRLLYSNIRWSKNVYEENWSTGGNYLGCTIYPSPEGLAKSIRLEALRDGIEDYDYLALLRSALQTYRDAPDKRRERAALEAEEILADDSLVAGIRSPAHMYELRSRIAELIERL